MGKGWVNLEDALCYIFMYRTLTNPKLLRRLPDCGIAVYDVIGNGYRGDFGGYSFTYSFPSR